MATNLNVIRFDLIDPETGLCYAAVGVLDASVPPKPTGEKCHICQDFTELTDQVIIDRLVPKIGEDTNTFAVLNEGPTNDTAIIAFANGDTKVVQCGPVRILDAEGNPIPFSTSGTGITFILPPDVDTYGAIVEGPGENEWTWTSPDGTQTVTWQDTDTDTTIPDTFSLLTDNGDGTCTFQAPDGSDPVTFAKGPDTDTSGTITAGSAEDTRVVSFPDGTSHEVQCGPVRIVDADGNAITYNAATFTWTLPAAPTILADVDSINQATTNTANVTLQDDAGNSTSGTVVTGIYKCGPGGAQEAADVDVDTFLSQDNTDAAYVDPITGTAYQWPIDDGVPVNKDANGDLRGAPEHDSICAGAQSGDATVATVASGTKVTNNETGPVVFNNLTCRRGTVRYVIFARIGVNFLAGQANIYAGFETQNNGGNWANGTLGSWTNWRYENIDGQNVEKADVVGRTICANFNSGNSHSLAVRNAVENVAGIATAPADRDGSYVQFTGRFTSRSY